jgi:hypothetical protein
MSSFSDLLDEAKPIADELRVLLQQRTGSRHSLALGAVVLVQAGLVARLRKEVPSEHRDALEGFITQLEETVKAALAFAEGAGFDPTKMGSGGDA